MKKIYFIALLLLLSKSMFAQAGYVGEVRLIAGDYTPKNWMKCEGQLLHINIYQALFSLLGVTYGGDGVTTFALPDYRGRAAIGASTAIPAGTTRGSESVILSISNLPNHSHNANLQVSTNLVPLHVPTATSLIATPSITVNSVSYPVVGFNSDTPDTNLVVTTTGYTGSNTPINVNQPSLVLTYIICTAGVWPTPN